MSGKAAVAIDPWKLEIFTRHLKAAGYRFDAGAMSPEITILRVDTTDVDALGRVVAAANAEAKLVGGTHEKN